MKYDNSIREGQYTTDLGTFHHSVFNLDWLDNPKIVIDVGAYDFGDSIRIKQRFPECEVYSFEMSRDNFDKNFNAANKCGIHAYNLAISDVGNIYTKFYQSKHVDGVNAQGSLLKPNSEYYNRYGHIVSHSESDYPVETRRLDNFIEANNIGDIDLLHIDVEGYEYNVIQSLGRVRPKLIFAEFLIDGGWDGQTSFAKTEFLLTELMGYTKVGEYSFDRLYKHEE